MTWQADGLAAGKGVVVAMSVDEANEAIDSMLVIIPLTNVAIRITSTFS